ncbi:MAG: trypsin-like peptidase domain-containing protein [Parcubacteria group bacterium]|nr:trypsin-like peptidase domain-containing protein [Parcubacteria group bacterium]
MLSFFPNVIGALIGIFLALFLMTQLAKVEPPAAEESKPRDTLSFEEILPPKTIAYMEDGIAPEQLIEIAEKIVPPPQEDIPVGVAATPAVQSEPPKEPKTVTPEPPKAPLLSATALNTLVRASTVNIFCTLAGETDAASGSGIVIDPRGIVLTNAHIAQYFLLDTRDGEEFVRCAIRTGSPAEKSFSGELLYIPSAWIEAHAENITQNGWADNGEHDYALVRAVLSAEEATSSLPALSLAYDGAGLARTEPVLVASYPAGFLGGQAIQKNLWQVSSFTSIKELYRFATTSQDLIDVVSVNGIIGAQEGSSGGALVRTEDGKLLGVVVTRSAGDTTGERDLFSLSIPYVNADIVTDLKKTLQEFLASDIDAYQEWFNENVRPRLKEKLMMEIEK